jgi:copper homeostasis protein
MLEIVCYSYSAVLEAHKGGCQRIELCENAAEGGTTPSLGTILSCRKLSNMKIHVMIRPRGGDFIYTDEEINIMLKDIEIAKNSGVDGVVFGILKSNGNIDYERTLLLVQAASGLSITFHRAFDWVNDPVSSLETLISLGIDRVLTSGCESTAIKGIYRSVSINHFLHLIKLYI